MKKCLIVVDYFDHIVDKVSKKFNEYTKNRTQNLINLMSNKSFEFRFKGNQNFFFELSNFKEYDANEVFDEYYICGSSLSQCVTETYHEISSQKRYIIKDCCVQEFFDIEDSGNPDHPKVSNITELIKFENDFLDGKMRFKFYDNSPGNDGNGEWVYGEFEKINYINVEDLL